MAESLTLARDLMNSNMAGRLGEQGDEGGGGGGTEL
jgi:hypothetical protein